MSKLYLGLACLLLAYTAGAQCPSGRYLNEIFPSVTVDSPVYSTPYSLKMDIYQPAGDTLHARPLIILAHGGSFLTGTREDDPMVDSLCLRLAKRGYVTASIDYRLSELLTMLSTDSTGAIDEVVKAMSDGKAAIRFFMKDASTTNTYKIDTNNIYIGGNSAGAVLYMHVGYISDTMECPSYIRTAIDANGGFDGNSGNDGYTVRSKGIIDLAGGLNETSFVQAGDKPSVNAQGAEDEVVPYTCGYPNLGSSSSPLNVHVKLCGLGSLEPVYTANGIYHLSMVFPVDGHVPWNSNAAKLNLVDSLVKVFLYNLVCTSTPPSSVNTTNINTEVTLYPNPANEALNIMSSELVKDITLFDEVGRVAVQARNINKTAYEVNTAHLSKGIYFVKISFENGNITPVTRKILVNQAL